jgi:mono/diheme cytochrome c family protein
MTRPVIAPFASAILVASLTTAMTGVAAVAGAQHSTKDEPLSLLMSSLSGMQNFASYCAPCHGHDGKGRGPVADALTSPPSDLTKLAARNKGVFPTRSVRDYLTHGNETVQAHGSRTMPVWGPTFRAFDSSDKAVALRIANLVTYLESIQP